METVDQLLQGMLSLLLRCDLSRSACLCLKHEPYSTTLISLTEDDDDVRDIGKHDLRSVLIHPILPNANHKTKLKSSRSCLTCSPCEIVPRGLFKTMLDSD